jgi:hypothetical protein
MTTQTHPDPLGSTPTTPVSRNTRLDAHVGAFIMGMAPAPWVPPVLHEALRGMPKT